MSMDRFKDAFRDEAVELLIGLESTLLSLEENPERNLVDSVFRTVHTIKGSSSMFGFDEVSRFSHRIETLLDMLRSGNRFPGRETISCILSCRDFLLGYLQQGNDLPGSGDGQSGVADDLLRRLEETLGRDAGQPLEDSGLRAKAEDVTPHPDFISASGTAPVITPDQEKHIYRISFQPAAEIFSCGLNPLPVLRNLFEEGDVTCIAFEDVPPLSSFDPGRCYFRWDLLFTTVLTREAVQEIFMFFEGRAGIRIERIADLSAIMEEPEYKRLGAILIERGVSSPAQVEKAAGKQKRLGELLVEDGVPRSDVAAAVEEQEHIRRLRDKFQHDSGTASVRVSSDKLDLLVDLVGELVTVQARLSQTAGEIRIPLLSAIAEQVERLTDEIRDSAMGMRMMPIGATFSRFKRLVRDLSQELGKNVDLSVQGGDTELDKTVIEKLSDPLVHLIRNSLDHGIELPAERREKGKPEMAVIELSAYHSGANVFVSVRDDGRGLDPVRIRTAAVRKGLITADAQISEKEMSQLIFLPGFSTADKVTSVSGRGVGMDVVKKNIELLGGSISLKSEQGRGTEILLRLPLTLAIVEGLLVDVSGNLYVIPLAHVEECLRFDGDSEKGRRILNNRGESLPYVVVSELFGLPRTAGGFPQIVVVDSGAGKIGVLVDNVIGNHQTVIKNLGKMYRNVEGVSGATILGDGSVALIMDIQKLSTLALREEGVFTRAQGSGNGTWGK